MKIHLPILLAMSLAGAGGAAQAAAVPVVTIAAPQCHAAVQAGPCRSASLAPPASHVGDALDDPFHLPGDDLQALDDYVPAPAAVPIPAADAAPVPEPAPFLMLLAGVVLLGLRSARQEKCDKFSA
ncbi:hypothetical protein H3H36_20220 [Duganella sp. FT3S]|uniref:PEP-CTERM sorting domain-containing protein n=1 Tax=Rugamonas fusca TaxID=2758568 RepID=A0A7W2EKN9_9BURK|nr:PEP-CTERM sorting domain-containing protein [Rugamonas fusca]MBA5607687.1 hypothetical protein [Rugamonas fusca]